MSLDQRARAAGADVRHQLATIEPPESRAVVRRSRRGRVATGVAGVVVLLAAGLGLYVALRNPDPSTVTSVSIAPGWRSVTKAEAGLPEGSLAAVASDGEVAVLGGGVTGGDDWWHAGVWWSDDGFTWQEGEHPEVDGEVFSVAVHDGTAIAAGTYGDRADPYQGPFVWRSEDSGRTWSDVALPLGELGPDASEMGRPNMSELRYHDGWWVASGGSSTGYAAVWASRTGEEWEQVLESDEAGSVGLLELSDGRLAAYAFDLMWITDDPTDWGDPVQSQVDPDVYPMSIAPGASLAVAESYLTYTDRRVVRSNDEGRTWVVDESFTGAFPSTAAQFGDLQIVTGADGENRPTAWISTDAGWDPIPEALRGTPGGVLDLVAQVDGRIVVFGTAPELGRYFVFQP